MKYIILANSNDTNKFELPRQLIEINGEPLIVRTIRLLKENGINEKDIIITASNKMFDNLGVIRYTPLNNDYDYQNKETTKGYWLNAFSPELMIDPVCFIWGDVYFSEYAIKTIVETKTNSHLFFCSYKNRCKEYIKQHDEPFAYKIIDTNLFLKHINLVKEMYDKGLTARHPIVWEVYRSLNKINVNWHIMTTNYVAINDITCDIDNMEDVYKLRYVIGGNMVRIKAKETFSCSKMTDVKEIIRDNVQVQDENTIYIGDIILITDNLAKYLNNELDRDYKPGNNPMDRPIKFEILEVIPEKNSSKEKIQEEKVENVEVKTKRTRKAKSK